MRVLLVYTAIPEAPRRRGGDWTPLGTAYLAAALRQAGHPVRLHNRLTLQTWHGCGLPRLDRATGRLLREFAPDLVGISGVTASFADMVAVADMARDALPRALIVLGGPHATTVPCETLERIPAADCLVAGEGEQRIVQLADGIPPDTLPGVAWRDADGQVRMSPWQAPEYPLDTLPAPARDLLDMPRYLRHSRGAVRGTVMPCICVLSSRGCTHRCAFCSEPAYSIRGYRAHSPEHTVAEVKGLVEQYRVPLVTFLDESFTCDRERVMRLAALWRKEGLDDRVRFVVQARADQLDEEMLAVLKQAGCLQLELGVESGSDRVLKLMNKGCTVAQNCAAAEIVQRSGIRLQVNIICGTPGETEQELRASLELVEQIQPAAAGIGPYMVFPGTEFARRLIAENRLAPDFWDIRDRQSRPALPNFSAMSDEVLAELRAEGRHLAWRLNEASICTGRPWWYRAARRARRRARLLLRRDRQRTRRKAPA